MTEIKVFEKEGFGSIRTVEIDSEVWFIGKDVAESLGYENPSVAISKKVEDEDKRFLMIETADFQNGNMLNKTKTAVINESGLYALIFSSKLKKAKEFKHWVTSEVLPSIRKTGSYTIHQPQTSEREFNLMEDTNRIEKAKLLERIADKYDGKSKTFREVLYIQASNIAAGKEILALPTVNEKMFSASEIAEKVSSVLNKKISSQKIGSLANSYSLKTDDNGEWRRTKSPYSAKEVDSFFYKESSVSRFVDILREAE